MRPRTNRRVSGRLAVIAASFVLAGGAVAQPATAGRGGPGNLAGNAAGSTASEWVILGTASGPNSEAARAQPANALISGGRLYLVDAGDGAVAQLAKAGLRLPAVRAVFLSHLHFDHTGGLFAVLGLRMQLEQRGPLQVYGPPGTEELVNGLLAAAGPGMRAGWGIPGQSLSADIDVVELVDGESLTVDGFTVTVAENSHFSPPEGAPGPIAVSLSYRFELPDRSIVFTGDTGPSAALVELARGADLLVSEMIDVETVLATMRPPGSAAPAAGAQPTGFDWHMRTHHMTPIQVGELAAAAGVGRLVITHFAPNPTRPEQAEAYLDAIAENFAGEVVLAKDLDRF